MKSGLWWLWSTINGTTPQKDQSASVVAAGIRDKNKHAWGQKIQLDSNSRGGRQKEKELKVIVETSDGHADRDVWTNRWGHSKRNPPRVDPELDHSEEDAKI